MDESFDSYLSDDSLIKSEIVSEDNKIRAMRNIEIF